MWDTKKRERVAGYSKVRRVILGGERRKRERKKRKNERARERERGEPEKERKRHTKFI